LVTTSGTACRSGAIMTDQIHLVVATPCFGGQVSSIYAGSIFHL
jgi:hypothetical protein